MLVLTHIIFFGEASPHPAARLFRAGLLPFVAPLLPPLLHRRRLVAAGVRMLAQPFVRYPHSPLSQDGVRGSSRWPRPGYRLPDQQVVTVSGPARLHELTATPGVHVLLERQASWETAGLGAMPTGALVHVHRLLDCDGRGAVGVRPDGYVGFRGGVVDRQLGGWLSLVGARPR